MNRKSLLPALALGAALILLAGACQKSPGQVIGARTPEPTGSEGLPAPSSSPSLSNGPLGLENDVYSPLPSPTSASSNSSSGSTAKPTAGTPASKSPNPVTPAPPSTGSGNCPDPRYCPNYTLLGGRWAIDSTGNITIHYRINPDGYQGPTPLTQHQFIDATNEAAKAWMDANPAVRLVYDGTTTERPSNYGNPGVNSSVVGNYNNVIGFDPAPANSALTDIPNSGTYAGFDIRVRSFVGWTWTPCNPPHGQPCDSVNSESTDIQSTMTHEWGHVLGLGHVSGSENQYITMNPGSTCTRCRNTLALGDILGVRHLYPTSAPMPTIYNP